MPRRLQIFWTRSRNNSSCSYITHLAGRNPDGSRWELDATDALAALELGLFSFYVIRQGRVVDIVAGVFEGHQYLKCSGEERVPQRLLGLPAFEPAPPVIRARSVC